MKHFSNPLSQKMKTDNLNKENHTKFVILTHTIAALGTIHL